MAKRADRNEPKFNPLSKGLVSSVISGNPAGTQTIEPPTPVPMGTSHPEVRLDTKPSPVPTRPSPDLRVIDTQSAPPMATRATRRSREKRVLLTLAEEQQFERFVTRLGERLQTPVKTSHVLRGLITVLLNAEDDIFESARSVSLVRPGNGDAPKMLEFEHGISTLLHDGIRDARQLR